MNENQIVVYQPNETVRLDVRLENETVWLNRHQMAQLFGRDIKTIGKHIANALNYDATPEGMEELNVRFRRAHKRASVVWSQCSQAVDLDGLYDDKES